MPKARYFHKFFLLLLLVLGLGIIVHRQISAAAALDAPVLEYPIDIAMPAGPQDFAFKFTAIPNAASYSMELYQLAPDNVSWKYLYKAGGFDSPVIDTSMFNDGYYAWSAWAVDSGGVENKKSQFGYFSLGRDTATKSGASIPGQTTGSSIDVPETGDVNFAGVKNPIITKNGYKFSVLLKSTFKTQQSVEISSHCSAFPKGATDVIIFNMGYQVLSQPFGSKKHTFIYPLTADEMKLVKKAQKKKIALECHFAIGGKGSANETDYSNNEQYIKLKWKAKKLKIIK
ncbi:hypothetical protein HYW83_02610 [Candidatus Peregrinibacteria bacterium]|nr:hypothetical protein [Candidatus Peregrinibacteria bacterium]